MTARSGVTHTCCSFVDSPEKKAKSKDENCNDSTVRGYPHLLLISRFAREEGKRKDEYCNDSTVTHTCCSLVGLSEKKAKRKDVNCNDSTVTHTCCSFVDLSETRLLQVSLHERLCYVSWVYCVWQLTEVRECDVSYNDVWYVLHLFKNDCMYRVIFGYVKQT